MYRGINPFEVSILEQPAGHACFTLYHEAATRIARVVERVYMYVCVCVSVERAWGVRRNLYSRFGRLSCVLQAWWLCAAMRLCYHTIEHLYVHIPSPHFFLSLFFFFSFILNPRSRFGDNQSEGDQGLDAPFRIMWSGETLTAKLHGR